MKPTAIQATVPANAVAGTPQIGPITININMPETIEEAISVYGGPAVLSNALSKYAITLQANIRNAMRKGESQESIQARLADAKMGVAVAGAKVDPIAAFMANFASQPKEKQQELLSQLRAKAQGK